MSTIAKLAAAIVALAIVLVVTVAVTVHVTAPNDAVAQQHAEQTFVDRAFAHAQDGGGFSTPAPASTP